MTIELTEDERKGLRKAGRVGGLRYAANNDVHAATARARAAKESRWILGHGCKVCGPRIDIPSDLPQEERERRATALKKLHYTLMAERSSRGHKN